jgi:hypothetical protein
MAYKNKGNALTKPELQAGYTIENDGYGLLTSRLAYRIDQTRVESNAPKKGDPHPKDSRLTAWKVMWTRDHNDFATIQADYIGFAGGHRHAHLFRVEHRGYPCGAHQRVHLRRQRQVHGLPS